jgi:hypothetical protein
VAALVDNPMSLKVAPAFPFIFACLCLSALMAVACQLIYRLLRLQSLQNAQQKTSKHEAQANRPLRSHHRTKVARLGERK